MENLLALDPATAVAQVMNWGTVQADRPQALMDLIRLVQVHGDAAIRAAVTCRKSVGGRPVEGRTPLHFVCQMGCGEYAEMLVARGADISATDMNGRTPLHDAVDSDCMRCVRAVLGDGIESIIAPLLSYPLQQAYTEVAGVLMGAGPEVKKWAESRFKSLHVATFPGQLATVRIIVEGGVDLRAKKPCGIKVSLIMIGDNLDLSLFLSVKSHGKVPIPLLGPDMTEASAYRLIDLTE